MLLFETERTIVTRFTNADSEAFFLVNGNEEVMRFIRPAKNRGESDAFLQENINLYLDGSCIGRFAVFEKKYKQFIGTFSFLYLSGEADFHLGYALLPEHWGKGFATELTRAGIDHYFANTSRSTLFAITVPENQASQKVLTNGGFFLQGQLEENGKTVDVFYVNKDKEPLTDIQNK